ncbi:MAG: single-stranded DNA-binding protein [Thermotogota bacterium]
MFDVNQLLEDAVNETRNLKDGEIFLVKDLFKGYFWKRIPHGDRLLLGILFLNHVNQTTGDIQIIEKTSSKQQRYKKTESQ